MKINIAWLCIWLSGFFTALGMPFRLSDLVNGLSDFLWGVL